MKAPSSLEAMIASKRVESLNFALSNLSDDQKETLRNLLNLKDSESLEMVVCFGMYNTTYNKSQNVVKGLSDTEKSSLEKKYGIVKSSKKQSSVSKLEDLL